MKKLFILLLVIVIVFTGISVIYAQEQNATKSDNKVLPTSLQEKMIELRKLDHEWMGYRSEFSEFLRKARIKVAVPHEKFDIRRGFQPGKIRGGLPGVHRPALPPIPKGEWEKRIKDRANPVQGEMRDLQGQLKNLQGRLMDAVGDDDFDGAKSIHAEITELMGKIKTLNEQDQQRREKTRIEAKEKAEQKAAELKDRYEKLKKQKEALAPYRERAGEIEKDQKTFNEEYREYSRQLKACIEDEKFDEAEEIVDKLISLKKKIIANEKKLIEIRKESMEVVGDI